MFKGVIFDIDGTLYDYQTTDKLAMKNFCAFVEKNLGVEEKSFRETYTKARNIIHNRLKDTAASHSRVLMIQTALELLGKIRLCLGTLRRVLEFFSGEHETLRRRRKFFARVKKFRRENFHVHGHDGSHSISKTSAARLGQIYRLHGYERGDRLRKTRADYVQLRAGENERSRERGGLFRRFARQRHRGRGGRRH